MKTNRISAFGVFVFLLFFAVSAQSQNQQNAKNSSAQELQQMVDNLKSENPSSPQLAKLEQKLSEEKQPTAKPTKQQLQQAIKGYQDRLAYLEKRQKANPANTAISQRIQEMKLQMGKIQKQLPAPANQ